MDSSQKSGAHDSNHHRKSSSRTPASLASLREDMEVRTDRLGALHAARRPRPSSLAPSTSQEPQKLSSAWDAWLPPPPLEEDQHSLVLEDHLLDMGFLQAFHPLET